MGWLALVTCVVGQAPHTRAQTCPAAGAETVTIAAVEDRLELRLADGRRLRLAGLDPALPTPGDPDLGDKAKAGLARLVAGRPLAVTLLARQPDRWGRLPAFVTHPDETTPGGLPGGLTVAALAKGLGRVLDEPVARACHAALLAAESRARQGRLGLWADPYYAVLAVDDRASFAERSATIVLVEGRLRAVESGPFRTKLRFYAADDRWRETLTAVVLPRMMKTFEGQGVDVRSLIGKTLRLRGLLDLRFGPQIELTRPDQIEIVTPAAAGMN